jgi:hypothetical protein
MRCSAWARGALLAMAALLLLPACAPAQRRLPTTETNWREFLIPTDTTRFLPGARAVTLCVNGQPRTMIPGADTMQAKHVENLWAHERVHIEQLRRNPRLTCEQAERVIGANPVLLVAAEAEAFCSQAHHGMREFPHVDPIPELLYSAEGYAAAYALARPQWGIPKEYIAAVFLRACPEIVKFVPVSR